MFTSPKPYNLAEPLTARSIVQGRLTLASGKPIPIDDQNAKTSVLYTPYLGNLIAIYDVTDGWVVRAFAEASLSLAGLLSGNIHDIFAAWESGGLVLKNHIWKNHGAAITNATNATPIVVTSGTHGLATGDEVFINGVGGNTAANGRWLVTVVDANSYSLQGSVGNGAYTASTGWMSGRTPLGSKDGVATDPSRPEWRHVGTIKLSGAGQCSDKLAQRFVANLYNKVQRPLFLTDATGHTYAAATYQVWRVATNFVELLMVEPGTVEINLVGLQKSGVAGNLTDVAVGIDSAAVASGEVAKTSDGEYDQVATGPVFFQGQGYHVINALEAAEAGTGTFANFALTGALMA